MGVIIMAGRKQEPGALMNTVYKGGTMSQKAGDDMSYRKGWCYCGKGKELGRHVVEHWKCLFCIRYI